MNFAEKLKQLRKERNMSQEELGEKIGVSRQAITKWETDGGMPDIDNLIRISDVFGIELDDLVKEKRSVIQNAYRYSSKTEYDIDFNKHYDIQLCASKNVVLKGYEGEKFRLSLFSNEIKEIESLIKVKLDDNKQDIDIDMKKDASLLNLTLQEDLLLEIELPQKYLSHTELALQAEELLVQGLDIELLEVDGKVSNIQIKDTRGNIELNSTVDMNVTYDSFEGRLEVNQLSASTTLNLPKDTVYRLGKKGKSTIIAYRMNGELCENHAQQNADNVVEFTGRKSELTINLVQ